MRLGLPYPKELYPVIRDNHYKPVAQFVLENLVKGGAGHLVFVVTEAKHQLIGYFGSGNRFGCDISYVVQETAPGSGQSTSPGLAHALDSAYHLTKGKTVFFGMADTIMQPHDVYSTAYAQTADDDDFVLVLFETDRPEKFGMVELDADDRVAQVVDKPRQTDLTHMWGCIIWRPSFTEHLHSCVERGISDFAEIMNSGIRGGMRARGVRMDGGTYIDLGTYDEIMEMDRRFREE